jgi:hypothetical protein
VEWVGDLERAFATAIYPNLVAVVIVGLLIALAVAVAARRGRWDLVARRRPRLSLAIGVVGLAIVLPTAWYLGSPLFTSTTIDEPAPVVVALATPAASVAPTPASTSVPSAPAGTSPSPVPTASPAPAPPLIERSGMFHGMDDFHFGRGTARLIETSPGSFTVRLESFAVRNGPDLYIYLSPSAKGYDRDSIEIGRLKADKGNQNYPLKAGTDLSAVRSVVIWCKQFAVLFATAPLE